jgi:hypothetical protein
MKDHSVSQSIAPPAAVPIEIQPSADALMTDWLAERVQQAIDIVVDTAAQSRISLKRISVFGTDYYDNSFREIFIWVDVDAAQDKAHDYWGGVASPIHALNQSPPAGAQNADVRLEVTVDW